MDNASSILALDASTEQGSVALFVDGKLRGQLVYRQPKAHARLIAPMVNTLLHDLDVPANNLNAVAVISGPGSYTGLRVATSTAKGLCLATGANLLSLSSLEMLALAARPAASQLDAAIYPLIDARRMEVFAQMFDKKGKAQNEAQALLLEEQPFDELLQKEKVLFVGDGVTKAIPLLESFDNAYFIEEWPEGLAAIGPRLTEKLTNNEVENLALFEPFYLKGVRITQSKKKK
ncbi:MAG: tRNA (adenosine(37)-N6)-threonylcarbamoyltransferase complex dimerization subunit type 1 TsaB [Bacteroidia bacterium]